MGKKEKFIPSQKPKPKPKVAPKAAPQPTPPKNLKGPAKALSQKQKNEKAALAQKAASTKAHKLEKLRSLRSNLLTPENFITKEGKVDIPKVREVASRIPPNIILSLQKKQPDILLLVYTKEEKATSTPGKLPKKFTFDTKGNPAINAKIGIVDFRRYDPSLKTVEVYSQTRGTIIGHSKGPFGNCYTDYGTYLAIFDGETITRKKDLSPQEAAKQQKLFKQNCDFNFKLFAKNLSPKLQKEIPKTSQKEIIEEAVRQGVDPKLIIALHSLGKLNPNLDLSKINLTELRWQMTRIQVSSQSYTNLSSKKNRDSKNLYNLGFLSFLAKRLQAPFEQLRTNYRKLTGVPKLTGTTADIKRGEQLAIASRSSRSTENLKLPIALARDPKLEKIWKNLTDTLTKNGIPKAKIAPDETQDGLTLISLRESALKMLTGPRGQKNLRLIKILIELGWKFNIRRLPQIDNFMNADTNDKSIQAYRNKHLAHLSGKPRPTLEKALEIISQAPTKHHILECVPSRAGIGDYCWRGAINTATAKTHAGWHSGIDLGGTWPVTAPTNCYLATVRPMAGSAGNYIKIRFKDKDGATITFSMCHFGHTDSFRKILQRYRSGNRHIRKGELLAVTGSTGNSTGAHLHLSVFRNGRRVDPFNWLPSSIKRRLIARRTDPKNAQRYDASRLRAKRSSWGLPNAHLHHHDHSHV